MKILGVYMRRRLVSILHAGGERAWRELLPSARTAGCVVAFVIAELRAPSRSSTAGGATPHASQSCSREPPPPPLACTLVHFGAVVADAPSPLSTPRSATGQAQLRLGKPLRMKCRASPVLLFMRAGRVVAGRVGIARATVPFHGEHDALEPTKEG